MRNISFALAACLCCFGVLGWSQEAVPTANEEQVTPVQNLDIQIKLIQQQIDKYSGMALAFQSKAQQLQFQDFEGFRHAAKMAEICQGIANDLKGRLQTVLDEKAKLLEKQPSSQDKK